MAGVIVIPEGTKLTLSDFIPDFIEEMYSEVCDQLPWFDYAFKFILLTIVIMLLEKFIIDSVYIITGRK